ncbi:E3 ubiquitin-protein ligase ATL4-like [Nicotiana tabacum]|uniref:E3 ubiquitin-protein ligase ATL4-like n=1 Tax=Nicotiana tabacum TaxID=4097 RepID=A0A1S4B037_TOBAC|nr:PREDICTED: E3 ubiquitin-protein ligase ATL4-like [Nicotiana tabacum]
MSAYYTQPPPIYFTTVSGGTIPSTAAEAHISNVKTISSSIMIVIIVVATSIIVSASIYLLLRLLSRRSSRTYADADDVISHPAAISNRLSGRLFESLPLFSFGSVTGSLTGIDCAVCLSKFESHDQLRLLPLCCHAFHRECIDTWLLTNQSCPLCRSTVAPTDADVLNKILTATNSENPTIGTPNSNTGSFQLEIGSVSRRRLGSDSAGRRSYSIGSFEYVVEEDHELSVDSIRRSEVYDKDLSGVPVPEPPVESLTAEVSGVRSWLRDYVDRIASFRSSGRFFFSGSSRRSDVVVPFDDLEAGRVGEEISEYFRWLSGV